MDTSYSYQDSLHFLNDSEWNKLPVQNRGAVMQSLENEVARREGRPPCNVSLYSEPPKNGAISAGKYSRANNSIGINTYHLSGNFDACLNTVLHEGRHAYQNKAVNGEIDHHNEAELKAWRDNMKPGHYITPEKNRRAYYRQPIEADAREYAAITSRQIQSEQKMQQNYNKGIASFVSKTASPSEEASSSNNKGIESFRNKVNGSESSSTGVATKILAANITKTNATSGISHSLGNDGQGR